MSGDLSLAVQFIAWALYVVIFTSVAIRLARLPTRAHADMALFFGLTGLLSIVGGVVAALGLETTQWLNELNTVLLLCMPYVLLRLVGDFADLPAHLQRWAEVGMGLAVAAILLVPPQFRGPITVALIVYFFGLLSFDALSFFKAARNARGVTRRRLLAIGAGSVAVGAVILFGVLASAIAPLAAFGLLCFGVLASAIAPLAAFGLLCSRLADLFSAAAYYVGFAPPVWLRKVWQEPALRDFLDLSSRLTSEPETRLVVRELEDAAAQTIGVSATVGLWIEAERTLRFFARGGPRPRSSSTGQDVSYAEDAAGGYYDIRPGSMLAGRAFEHQELVFAADVLKEDPAYAPYYTAAGSQAVMVAPISARQRRLGVLVAYAHRSPLFAESDLEVLQLLANQMAVILDNRLLIEEAVDARAQEAANRLRDELLAVISHDLRNPLAAIRGIGQVLERRLARAGEIDRAQLASALGIIDGSSNQMSDLIDQLLDYAGSSWPNRSTWTGKRSIWWRSPAELSSRLRRRARSIRSASRLLPNYSPGNGTPRDSNVPFRTC